MTPAEIQLWIVLGGTIAITTGLMLAVEYVNSYIRNRDNDGK